MTEANELSSRRDFMETMNQSSVGCLETIEDYYTTERHSCTHICTHLSMTMLMFMTNKIKLPDRCLLL